MFCRGLCFSGQVSSVFWAFFSRFFVLVIPNVFCCWVMCGGKQLPRRNIFDLGTPGGGGFLCRNMCIANHMPVSSFYFGLDPQVSSHIKMQPQHILWLSIFYIRRLICGGLLFSFCKPVNSFCSSNLNNQS